MNSQRSDKAWLGGDPQGEWSNHYELLGLPAGFSDTVVIARVADQLMKRIRAAAKQEVDVDHLRGLAKSVLEAKSCLTEPEHKANYDKELLAQNDSPSESLETAAGGSPGNPIAAEEIPQAIPVAIPISNTAASVESKSLPFNVSEPEPISHRVRRRSGFWSKLGTVVVAVGLFAVLAMLTKHYLLDNESLIPERTPTVAGGTTNSRRNSTPVGQAQDVPLGTAESTDTTAGDGERQHDDNNDSPPMEIANGPKPDEGSTTESDTALAPPLEAVAAPLTRDEADALSNALIAARTSLPLQDFNAAAESLARAHEIARNAKHKELIERLDELTHYAREYWAAIDDAWNSLSAGTELRVGNTIVNVVEVDSDRITVHVAGRNQRYPRNKLPKGLQKTIIDGWLDPSAASSDVIRGAFHATQDPPNEQAARDHWESAQQRGANVEKLIAILSDTYAIDDLLDEQNGNSD